ncbi:EutN/CcmL family microcompartment protein [Leekyejoonella antrihumi]|uniref:Ethanolamine utilization protein EutN n=1 Tax=Leekyejoonella antrihumi TaxID=1660198 RepID=A0A563DR65_9MICO|nr:EutN/CcmL family microcompartment protein [Leekyejoonella antrihumi]TWP32686.1 ethanolamine utilization protein EutN [Leekyejoonella antrihumi]
MISAVVTGNVWSTRRVDGLPSGAFLELEIPATGARMIAFDVLGVGLGEHVLVAQGSVASHWFTGPPPPVDALIIGSIDAGSTGSAPGSEGGPPG